MDNETKKYEDKRVQTKIFAQGVTSQRTENRISGIYEMADMYRDRMIRCRFVYDMFQYIAKYLSLEKRDLINDFLIISEWSYVIRIERLRRLKREYVEDPETKSQR